MSRRRWHFSPEHRARISAANRRLSDEQVDVAVAAYQAGATLRQIAGMLPVGHSAVRTYLVRRGVQLRRRGVRPGR